MQPVRFMSGPCIHSFRFLIIKYKHVSCMTYRGTSIINNYVSCISKEVCTDSNVYFRFLLLRFGTLWRKLKRKLLFFPLHSFKVNGKSYTSSTRLRFLWKRGPKKTSQIMNSSSYKNLKWRTEYLNKYNKHIFLAMQCDTGNVINDALVMFESALL